MNHIAPLLSPLLSRLKKVKSTGKNKWTACCPAHTDSDPSLSISIGEKGQVLLHCFAGCSAAQVIGELDLDFADLYPPDSRFAASGRGLQTNRPPLPRWARPGNEERLRRATRCLFLLCVDAYPEGSQSRELAGFALCEASEVLGGVI